MTIEQAQQSFNSKRSDLVITDRQGYPLALIEYQGNKHFQGNAPQRDAIKRIVAHQTGIKFIEVLDLKGDLSDQQIEQALENQLLDLLAE